jgi:hypothetical protein
MIPITELCSYNSRHEIREVVSKIIANKKGFQNKEINTTKFF